MEGKIKDIKNYNTTNDLQDREQDVGKVWHKEYYSMSQRGTKWVRLQRENTRELGWQHIHASHILKWKKTTFVRFRLIRQFFFLY